MVMMMIVRVVAAFDVTDAGQGFEVVKGVVHGHFFNMVCFFLSLYTLVVISSLCYVNRHLGHFECLLLR